MTTVSDTLPSRFNMPPGMHLFSKNRQYNLKMRDTGNLALYNTAGQLLWESGTSGGSYNNVRVVMQDNGDMVLRRVDNGSAVYASDTDGNPGAYLKVLDDGSIRIYATDGRQLWSINQ